MQLGSKIYVCEMFQCGYETIRLVLPPNELSLFSHYNILH